MVLYPEDGVKAMAFQETAVTVASFKIVTTT